MAVLGTTYDPYYRQDQMQRTAQALAQVADAFRRRREERRARDLDEYRRFVAMAQEDPSLADTWGADLSKRLGSRYPEMTYMVEALRKRDQLAQEVPTAVKRWEGLRGQIETDYERRKTEVEQMPLVSGVTNAAVGTPMGTWNVPIPEINQDRAAAQKELAARDPQYIPHEALRKMTPRERDLVSIWAKSQGLDIPSQELDLARLPNELYAGVMGSQGELPPDVFAAWRYKVGLEQDPATLQYQGFQAKERQEGARIAQDLQKDRQLHEVNQARLNDERSKARIILQNNLNDRLAARNLSRSKELASFKEGLSGGGEGVAAEVSWKTIKEDSDSVLADWQKRRKEAKETASGSGRADAVQAFDKANPRPSALSEVQARRLARRLNQRVKAGELDVDEAESGLTDILSSFSAKSAWGMPAEEALDESVEEWEGGGDSGVGPILTRPLPEGDHSGIVARPPRPGAAGGPKAGGKPQAQPPADRAAEGRRDGKTGRPGIDDEEAAKAVAEGLAAKGEAQVRKDLADHGMAAGDIEAAIAAGKAQGQKQKGGQKLGPGTYKFDIDGNRIEDKP